MPDPGELQFARLEFGAPTRRSGPFPSGNEREGGKVIFYCIFYSSFEVAEPRRARHAMSTCLARNEVTHAISASITKVMRCITTMRWYIEERSWILSNRLFEANEGRTEMELGPKLSSDERGRQRGKKKKQK